MTGADLLPAAVLTRKAVVYVRQSTQTQVQINLESRRRQYELVEVARRRGFRYVEVIDDDLGHSASGMVARPDFERLVAWLCAGEVGAVLCFDASRLARTGRDCHHLLELCGLVEARVIDLDGVYDPCRPNDRLLLGMKGSISEFELGVLRARMLDAARAKAWRVSCASACRSVLSGVVTSTVNRRWNGTPQCANDAIRQLLFSADSHSKSQCPNILKQSPKFVLRCHTHSSIRVQEGQPMFSTLSRLSPSFADIPRIAACFPCLSGSTTYLGVQGDTRGAAKSGAERGKSPSVF